MSTCTLCVSISLMLLSSQDIVLCLLLDSWFAGHHVHRLRQETDDDMQRAKEGHLSAGGLQSRRELRCVHIDTVSTFNTRDVAICSLPLRRMVALGPVCDTHCTHVCSWVSGPCDLRS